MKQPGKEPGHESGSHHSNAEQARQRREQFEQGVKRFVEEKLREQAFSQAEVKISTVISPQRVVEDTVIPPQITVSITVNVQSRGLVDKVRQAYSGTPRSGEEYQVIPDHQERARIQVVREELEAFFLGKKLQIVRRARVGSMVESVMAFPVQGGSLRGEQAGTQVPMEYLFGWTLTPSET